MARHRASGHTIGVPRELWQAVFFIQTPYPDRICYHPGQPIRIGYAIIRIFQLRRHFHPDVSHPELCFAAIPPGCLTSGTHLLQIFCIQPLTPDGRGGCFNFPGQTYLDPLSTYPESFAYILHSAAVFS